MTDSKMLPAIFDLLKTRYGISGNLKQLPGKNNTYHVEADTGTAYVFKQIVEESTTSRTEIKHLAVETLMHAELGIMLPRVIPTREGDLEASVKTRDGDVIRGHLLSFV
ncbi:MAG: hypothetical protein MI802_23360, partial [Desulfobacterales bacterium]|nr:hypothetical protein [Desulfobacterales bacterium]